MIEQNANKALSIADRGYVLETGNIVLSGTGKELLKLPMKSARLISVGEKEKEVVFYFFFIH